MFVHTSVLLIREAFLSRSVAFWAPSVGRYRLRRIENVIKAPTPSFNATFLKRPCEWGLRGHWMLASISLNTWVLGVALSPSRSHRSLHTYCLFAFTIVHYNMQHDAEQQLLEPPLLFCRWSWELGSGRCSRGTRCMTVVRPRGRPRAPRVTELCRKRPW